MPPAPRSGVTSHPFDEICPGREEARADARGGRGRLPGGRGHRAQRGSGRHGSRRKGLHGRRGGFTRLARSAGRQEELLKAVVALGKPVVLVLLNGRPLSIGWAAENVPASSRPGSPAARAATPLPTSCSAMSTRAASCPSSSRARAATRRSTTPATSPTRQKAADLQPALLGRPADAALSLRFWPQLHHLLDHQPEVSAPQVKLGSSVAVTADVTNTGSVAGDEVVQLYIHQQAGSDSRPMRELKGFERLTLKPGETKTVTFTLGPAELGIGARAPASGSRMRKLSTCGSAQTRWRRSTRNLRWSAKQSKG